MAIITVRDSDGFHTEYNSPMSTGRNPILDKISSNAIVKVEFDSEISELYEKFENLPSLKKVRVGDSVTYFGDMARFIVFNWHK